MTADKLVFCFFQYVKRLKSPSENVMEIELRKGANKGKYSLYGQLGVACAGAEFSFTFTIPVSSKLPSKIQFLKWEKFVPIFLYILFRTDNELQSRGPDSI